MDALKERQTKQAAQATAMRLADGSAKRAEWPILSGMVDALKVRIDRLGRWLAADAQVLPEDPGFEAEARQTQVGYWYEVEAISLDIARQITLRNRKSRQQRAMRLSRRTS